MRFTEAIPRGVRDAAEAQRGAKAARLDAAVETLSGQLGTLRRRLLSHLAEIDPDRLVQQLDGLRRLVTDSLTIWQRQAAALLIFGRRWTSLPAFLPENRSGRIHGCRGIAC